MSCVLTPILGKQLQDEDGKDVLIVCLPQSRCQTQADLDAALAQIGAPFDFEIVLAIYQPDGSHEYLGRKGLVSLSQAGMWGKDWDKIAVKPRR